MACVFFWGWYLGIYGLFSKSWAPSGHVFYYGTECLGIPKWDPNFGDYPEPKPLHFLGNSAPAWQSRMLYPGLWKNLESRSS